MMDFRTKAQTLEAIIYVVSTKDKIDPALLGQMDKKLDTTIHLLQSLL
jgi:hypothetical protein